MTLRKFFTVAEDGSIYFLICRQPGPETLDGVWQSESDLDGISNAGDEEARWQLYKFNPNGEKLFPKDVTSRMDTWSACYMTADTKGYLYIGSESAVWRYDAEGNERESISLEQMPEDVSAGGFAGQATRHMMPEIGRK